MREGLPVLLAIVLEEEVVKAVEVMMGPDVGEVSRGADGVDLQEVLVIFLVGLVGLVGLAQKAKPDAPLIQE